MFTQAVAQLYQVVETPYPGLLISYIAIFEFRTIYYGKFSLVYFDQALNCARALARIVPFLLENENSYIRDLFWNRQTPPISADEKQTNEEGENEDTNNDGPDTEPLAVILINSLFHLLFLPGDTCLHTANL